VSAEIAAARAKGFDVERLQRAADAQLKFDTPDYRDGAILRLNRLRLAIPLKKERVLTAGIDDGAEEDEVATPRRRRKK
jgi:hypothetical protein